MKKKLSKALVRTGIIGAFVALLLCIGAYGSLTTTHNKATLALAQSSNLGTLSGYAWSDNLGWISFSGSNYQVVVQSDGTLAGYAWANPSDDGDVSNNIGWISFNAADTASCGSPATLSGTTITGWAKAIAADNNGWNGCISLSGSSPAYGVTLGSTGSSQSGLLDGYAWGDNTVGGWISFNCDTGGPTDTNPATNICGTSNYSVLYTTNTPQVPLGINSFFASPSRVNKGETTTLKYTVANPPASCTITGANGFSANVSPVDSVQGSIATNAINSNTNFTMTCGSVSSTITVGLIPVYIEQ